VCLILVGIDARPDSRVLLLANRDEFHARAAAAAAPWEQDASVLGGRDLVAGGSWLAVRADGRFAAVTNVRDGLPQPAPRSRGDLVREFVLGRATASDYLDALRPQVANFAPFNLILGDGLDVVAFEGVTRRTRPLGPGLHAISNGALDACWPKMRRSRQLLAEALEHDADTEALLALLRDRAIAPDDELPDTGFGLERERMLSPIFIRGDGYGTRASTLLEIGPDGQVDLVEARFGPNAAPSGRDHWRHLPDAGAWFQP